VAMDMAISTPIRRQRRTATEAIFLEVELSFIAKERGVWHKKVRFKNCRGHKRATRFLAVASVTGL